MKVISLTLQFVFRKQRVEWCDSPDEPQERFYPRPYGFRVRRHKQRGTAVTTDGEIGDLGSSIMHVTYRGLCKHME